MLYQLAFTPFPVSLHVDKYCLSRSLYMNELSRTSPTSPIGEMQGRVFLGTAASVQQFLYNDPGGCSPFSAPQG